MTSSSSALTSSMSANRKRTLGLSSSTLAATTTTTATTASSAIVTEPLAQRPRYNNTNHHHHRDIVTTQLETLQAELEHERSLRALDQRRFGSTQQRLERQIQFAVEEANEAKTLMEEHKQKSEEYAEQLRNKYQILQENYHDLQYRLDCDEAEATTVSTSRENNELVLQLQEQADLREEEIRGLQETIEELQQELASAMKRQSIPKIPSPENPILQSSPAPPQVMKELNTVRLQLQESEREGRQLQRSNDKLQAMNKELRLGQLEQSQISKRATQLEQQLVEKDQALAMAQAQVTSWIDFGANLTVLLQASSGGGPKVSTTTPSTSQSRRGGGGGSSSGGGGTSIPPEISVIQRYLQDATKEARIQREQNQGLETQLKMAEDQIQARQGTIRELEQSKISQTNQLKDIQKQLQISEGQVQVLQGQERVWKREVEALRSIVQTFDALPLPGKVAASEASEAKLKLVQASADAAQAELKVLRQAKAELQSECDATLKAKIELQTQHDTVMEKFGKLREAVYSERSKAEKAEARAVQAEELAGKGSFNPETTRVLHMQVTPLTEALKQEVNVLRRQVEALSKTNQKKGVTTTPPDVDPNKLHQRLKESFKEQIGRFREGVYLLTGYRIDMIPDGERPKFKVRSMFAEQEEDKLLFQWPTTTPVESLDLLDTELAKVLITTPSYEYVKRFGSLPAFLASTQLNLFEKQTMM